MSLDMMATTIKKTLQEQAIELLGCKPENLQKYLYALGIRQTCGRCGGSGSYSYCQMYGTECFGCAGRCYVAAKVTKVVLAQLKEKIAAGELDALKAKWRANAEAKRAIAPMIDRIQAAYKVIGDDYTKASNAYRGMDVEASHAAFNSYWFQQVYRAQGMNNDLRRVMWDIEYGVKHGVLTDYVAALASLTELAEMAEALRDAWIALGWSALA